jgi:hypothetical protein
VLRTVGLPTAGGVVRFRCGDHAAACADLPVLRSVCLPTAFVMVAAVDRTVGKAAGRAVRLCRTGCRAAGVVGFVCCYTASNRTLFPVLVCVRCIRACSSTGSGCGFGIVTS